MAISKAPRVRLAGAAWVGGKLLVVRHQRDGKDYFLLPGGGLEWGETCAQGLAREFEEELSLPITVGPLLCVNESIDPDGRRHIVNLTFGVQLSSMRMKLHPDRRLREVRWMSPAELEKAVFYPDIREALLSFRSARRPRAVWVHTPWT